MSFITINGPTGEFKIPKTNAVGLGDYLTAANLGSRYIVNDGTSSTISGGPFIASAATNGVGSSIGTAIAIADGNSLPFYTARIEPIPGVPGAILLAVGGTQFTASGITAGQSVIAGLTVNQSLSVVSGLTNILVSNSSIFSIGVPVAFGSTISSSMILQGDSAGLFTFRVVRGSGASAGKNAIEVRTGSSEFIVGDPTDDMTTQIWGPVQLQSPLSAGAFVVRDVTSTDVFRLDTSSSIASLAIQQTSISSAVQIIGSESVNKFSVYDNSVGTPIMFNVDTIGLTVQVGSSLAGTTLLPKFYVYGNDTVAGAPIAQFGVECDDDRVNQRVIVTNIEPAFHNTYNCGSAIRAFNTVYSVNGVNPSDRRLKDHITDIEPDRALEILRALKPVEFRWKFDSTRSAGLIAQDLLDGPLDYLVDGEESLGIKYNLLFAYIIAAIQKLAS